MVKIRKVVLDVVKPQEPGIVKFSQDLGDLKGIDGVNIGLIEIDRKVENVRITLQGPDLDMLKITETIEALGGAIHSIDEVAAGKEIIKHARTLEDE